MSATQGFFLLIVCPSLPLSPAAQQWIYVVLMWVGFGTLAGLLATVIFPLRRFDQPVHGHGDWHCRQHGRLAGAELAVSRPALNPISPLGFLAATIGAFVLLVLYRLGGMCFFRHADDADNQRK